MSASEASLNWDLTPVIELLHSFRVSSQPEPGSSSATANRIPVQDISSRPDDQLNITGGYRKLGDFTAVWDYIAQKSSYSQEGVATKTGTHCEVVGGYQPQRRKEHESRNIRVEEGGEAVSLEEANVSLLQKPTREDGRAGSANALAVVAGPKVILTRPASEPDAVSPSKEADRAVTALNSNGFHSPATPGSRPKRGSESKSGPKVRPVLTGSAETKKCELISKLRERCANERKVLQRPQLLQPAFALSNISSKGIHVFIDVSNIMVGFHDCIKTARSIPTTTRVPRLPLSFHNLSLVLERGRPVRKRILVGSDRFPAIDEAERLGYEINILERVQKTKDTAPRKKKFANGDRVNCGKSGGRKVQDQSSESETMNAGRQLQRWVEQAVDEVLHLKMLESLVDTAEPSTIVLATGDAAQAEYSDGFMRMVERALEKGWRVELVSFGSTISRAYRQKDFRVKWSSRFVVIHLDVYSEYLLDL